MRWAVAVVTVALVGCGSGETTTCVSSRDCSAAGLVCDAVGGRCVECVTTVDCLAGPGVVCMHHACVTVTPCTSSLQCGGAVCDRALGYCVECVADADCTDGRVCREGSCGAPPLACESDRACSAVSQVCDVTTSLCVDCVRNADCPSGLACTATHHCAPSSDAGPDLGLDDGLADSGTPDLTALDDGTPDLGAPDVGAPDLDAPDLGAPDFSVGDGSAPFDAAMDAEDPTVDLGPLDFGPPASGGPATDAGGCGETSGTTCVSSIVLGSLASPGTGVAVTGTVPSGGERWFVVGFPAGTRPGAGLPRISVAPDTSFVLELSNVCGPPVALLACGVEATDSAAVTDYAFGDTTVGTAWTLERFAWPTTVYVRVTRRPGITTCDAATFTLTATR